MMEHLLQAKEVAKQLGLSKARIYQLVQSGELSHIRIGRRILFKPEDVLSFIEKHYKANSENKTTLNHKLPGRVSDPLSNEIRAS